MATDPESAAASLSDVARVEQRTREAVRYSYAASYQLLWGVLVAAGYLAEYFSPRNGWTIWIAVLVLSVGGGIVIRARRARDSGRPADYRVVWAQLALIAFGILWTELFSDPTTRQINALWPSFFMFAMVLFGIFVGRFYVILGISVTALTAIGYLWLGNLYLPWMAVVAGGALIASGLYLRRIGLNQ